MDEAVITDKRKYHRGRLTRKIYWIFGLTSIETKKGYTFLVLNRRSETLFPIIQRYFLNRTIIFLLNLNSIVEARSTITCMSDQFSVYVANHGSSRIVAEFLDLELQYYWMNHKKYFVNPISPGILTNSIEGFWTQMRKYIKRNIPIRSISDWLNFFLFTKNIEKNDQYILMLEMIHTISNQ